MHLCLHGRVAWHWLVLGKVTLIAGGYPRVMWVTEPHGHMSPVTQQPGLMSEKGCGKTRCSQDLLRPSFESGVYQLPLYSVTQRMSQGQSRFKGWGNVLSPQ
jgi:hypothetical protein